MTPDQVYDARDRFPGPNVPMPVLMDPHDVIELERLREMERRLFRPVAELLAAVESAQQVMEEAQILAAKAAEHERKGYKLIKVGAIRALRDALDRR